MVYISAWNLFVFIINVDFKTIFKFIWFAVVIQLNFDFA